MEPSGFSFVLPCGRAQYREDFAQSSPTRPIKRELQILDDLINSGHYSRCPLSCFSLFKYSCARSYGVVVEI